MFLVSRMVTQYRGTPIGDQRASAAPPASRARAGRAGSHVADDLAKYDPAIHLDTLKDLDGRPLPEADRSPFEYVGGAAPPPPEVNKQHDAPKPPPPPPPLPIKAMGYNDLPGGGKEAFVNYQDNMQVVHEGDTVGTRFKILKITPTALTLEDETDHTTHEMPFPP